MKPTARKILNAAIILAVGFCLGVFVIVICQKPRFSKNWFPLISTKSADSLAPSNSSLQPSNKISISYSEQIIIESDIPAPNVTMVQGRGKFLQHGSENNAVNLGYIVSVVTEPLKPKKIPDKYKTERTIQAKGGPLTVLPLEQATYEVHFKFGFYDKDGFEITTIDSPKHDIESGKTNLIQSEVQTSITIEKAALVHTISLHLSFDKCFSADQN